MRFESASGTLEAHLHSRTSVSRGAAPLIDVSSNTDCEEFVSYLVSNLIKAPYLGAEV